MKQSWLNHKTVILTGASGGIGSALTRLLIAEHGCIVIGIGRSAEKLQKLRDSLKESSRSFFCFAADLTEPHIWDDILNFLAENGLSADILINNAGILPNFEKFVPATLARTEQALALNFHAPVRAIAALLPMLEQSPTPAIVNITSSAALAALPGTSGYSAGKAALLRFTESMAVEYRKKIYISAICPGFTKTDIFRNQQNDADSPAIDLISMPAEKMARKILKTLRRRKSKAVLGADAKAMDIGYRFFGVPALRLFAWVMRRSRLPLFKDIF